MAQAGCGPGKRMFVGGCRGTRLWEPERAKRASTEGGLVLRENEIARIWPEKGHKTTSR